MSDWDNLEAAEQRGYANAMEAERKLHEDRIEELEAALAKAVELALQECPFREGAGSYNDWWHDRRAALAELKGQGDA